MNAQDIDRGMKALALVDKDIEHALADLGPPPPRRRPKGFQTLLTIIASQQISTEAARVIMERVTALMPDMTAMGLLGVKDQALRDVGLSWRKIEYAKGLADAVRSGHFDADGLEELSDKEAIDDLALQVALGRLKGVSVKPTPKQAREMVELWAPYRSVGALFLWHYYGRQRLLP